MFKKKKKQFLFCFDILNMYALVYVWTNVYVNVGAFMFIYRFNI